MKIYTKTGDKGQTSLIGGTRILKSDLRIDTYGTVDELNSWIGVLRDHDQQKTHIPTLLEIQDRLFTIGAILASDPEKSNMKIPSLQESDIIFLESGIDIMESELTPMKSFILPGGHPVVSFCHVARCVCRRAERLTVELDQGGNRYELTIKYLNRLSDYLFVLSRKLAQENRAVESPWTARM